MTTTSWILDKGANKPKYPFLSQSTSFGSSSLANRASSTLTFDDGEQIYRKMPLVEGTPHSGIEIYAVDKPSLGVQNRLMYGADKEPVYNHANPTHMTTPNIYSEKRSSLLKSKS